MTKLFLASIDNIHAEKRVRTVGYPTGRILGRRPKIGRFLDVFWKERSIGIGKEAQNILNVRLVLEHPKRPGRP